VLVALDRQERGQEALSATQEVAARHGVPVIAILTVDILMEYLARQPDRGGDLAAMREYRARYGA